MKTKLFSNTCFRLDRYSKTETINVSMAQKGKREFVFPIFYKLLVIPVIQIKVQYPKHLLDTLWIILIKFGFIFYTTLLKWFTLALHKQLLRSASLN